MKIGQRDVWIGLGKGERTPRKWWVVFTPLGREWISARVVGREKGFWLNVPRRLEFHGPQGSFMLALTPASRWGRGTKEDFLHGTGELRWFEWEGRRDDEEC